MRDILIRKRLRGKAKRGAKKVLKTSWILVFCFFLYPAHG